MWFIWSQLLSRQPLQGIRRWGPTLRGNTGIPSWRLQVLTFLVLTRKGQLQGNWLTDLHLHFIIITCLFHFISVFIGDVDRSWTCIHLYTTSIWESFTSISLQFFPTNEAITPREAEQLTRSAKCLSQMVVKNVFFAVASCINKYNFHEPIINPPSNHIKSYQTYSYIFRSFWRRFESFGLAVGRDGLSFWAFPGLGLAKVHQPMWGLSGKDMEGRKTVEHDKLLHGQHMVKLWLQSKIRRIPFQSEVCASLTFWHQRGTDSCVNASNCWSLAGSTHLHLGK